MKKLYFFDNLFFNENKGLYDSLLKPLNELSVYYQALGIKEPFSKELMMQAVKNTDDFISQLENDLKSVLQGSELPKVITNKLKGEINSKLNELRDKIEEIGKVYSLERMYTSFSLHLDYDFFEVSKTGQVTYSEQRLKDYCSVFVESQSQEQGILLVDEVNNKFAELQRLLKRKNITHGLTDVIERVNDEYRLKPEIVSRLI